MRGVYLLVGALLIAGCQKELPQTATPHPTTIHTTPHQTVILGTYGWDVESNRLISTPKSDFWYQRADKTHGSLNAQNGTTIEVVKESYASIDKASIMRRPALRDGRISNVDLKAGTVAIFKTTEGHYGKLKIKGFKALHDFNFKEAREYLDSSWQSFVLKKPDTKRYHLVVEYTLYN